MNNAELINVFNKMAALHEKHPDYTSLSITLGFSNDGPYEKWNIYTPKILHNDFSTARQLSDFIEKVITLGDDRYNAWELERAEEKLKVLMEDVEDTKDTIARLKKEAI